MEKSFDEANSITKGPKSIYSSTMWPVQVVVFTVAISNPLF
jgi:hypothetical protein